MPVKSLHLIVPDIKPYDRPDSWFETCVACNIKPILDTGKIRRFWFSRYGAIGNKSIRFRFDCDDLKSIEPSVEELAKKFRLGSEGYGDYDWAADLGKGENSRFLGDAHSDAVRRGDVVFNFLFATSRLFLDCLTGPDQDGYFHMETEKKSGFSLETSMEQFHHLFCNVTGVPCFAAVAQHPGLPGIHVMSLLEFAAAKKQDTSWQLVKPVNLHF
jgi:hypothetical protein